MFNFIITGTCSKGCSFCFTEEVARLKHSLGEMSVDQLNKLLDYYEFSPIKGEFSDVRILGGEPTQHSNFQGIADAVILRGLKINLFSNFLFGETTKEYIVNKIRGFRWMLPNSAELNEKNSVNYRRNRPRRCLFGRVITRKRLRSSRNQAPHIPV